MIKPAPRPTSLTLNLAPMVDVMMCLLIFFMLATKMVEQEHSHIDLPSAKKADEIKRDSASGRIVINIRRAEAGDRKAVYLLRDEVVPLDRILESLQEAVKLDPHISCLIRADRGLPYRDVDVVLGTCTRLGVRDISLGAIRQEGGN